MHVLIIMEEFLQRELCTGRLELVRGIGHRGGCISDAQSYQTDAGMVFVKHHSDPKAQVMFSGEFASLQAIHRTHTVRVPRPIKVMEYTGGGWMLAMEHLDMAGLGQHQATLGHNLARLHLHNAALKQQQEGSRVGRKEEEEGEESYVDQFGFDCQTCCGFIAMPNDWRQDWVEFYAQQRLHSQLELIQQKEGDRELGELWPRLLRNIPSLFAGLEIQPSLLHGDLWSGNAASIAEGPVVYDPASFYGHHEFELAIAGMFGGFTGKFYDAYHSLIPKSPGFAGRHKLYVLFHYLNHWNHFGIGYRSQSIALMRDLL